MSSLSPCNSSLESDASGYSSCGEFGGMQTPHEYQSARNSVKHTQKTQRSSLAAAEKKVSPAGNPLAIARTPGKRTSLQPSVLEFSGANMDDDAMIATSEAAAAVAADD